MERGNDYDSQRQQMMKNTGGFAHEQVSDYEGPTDSTRIREMKRSFEGPSGNYSAKNEGGEVSYGSAVSLITEMADDELKEAGAR